jgi:hypothetical protein
MKVPEAIQSLAKNGKAGQRLVEVVSGAPEDSEVAQVVQLVAQALAERPHGKVAANGNIAPPVDLSEAASVVDDLFFLHPRGKHQLAFFGEKLVVKTSKQDVTFMASDVGDVVILDSIPKDTKNRVYIMLNFKEEASIMNGKTKMRACVIQVTGDQQLDIQHPKDPAKRLSGIAAVVICQAIGCFGITGKATFHSSAAGVFRSCSGTAAVEAFVKARQGFLFPLLDGLCFLESPAIFIHKDKIRSVDFARAGGASSTFDFQVHLKNGAIDEFSNISRHELGCIQSWVEKLELPVGFPETDSEGEEGEAAGGNNETCNEASSDASDEDFDPYKKRAKKQKVDEGGEDGKSSDSSADSSSDDDSGGVELVDEEGGMKLSDLNKRLDTEREMKLKDQEDHQEHRAGGRNGGKEGCRNSSDDSDEDFDEGAESETDEESDSDGEVELVDEPDMKLSALRKHLDEEEGTEGSAGLGRPE